MRYVPTWFDHKRWDWFAAGNSDAERTVTRSSRADNSAQRLLFETGLVLLIPLALASLAQISLGA